MKITFPFQLPTAKSLNFPGMTSEQYQDLPVDDKIGLCDLALSYFENDTNKRESMRRRIEYTHDAGYRMQRNALVKDLLPIVDARVRACYVQMTYDYVIQCLASFKNKKYVRVLDSTHNMSLFIILSKTCFQVHKLKHNFLNIISISDETDDEGKRSRFSSHFWTKG